MTKKARSKKARGLPRTVAGVKVPKALRKSRSLGALLTSDLSREILADVIIAAAGAAAAVLTKSRTARAAAANAGAQAAEKVGGAAQTAAGAVAGVLTEAAHSLLPTSLLGEEEKPRYVSKSSRVESRKRSRDPEQAASRKRDKKTKTS